MLTGPGDRRSFIDSWELHCETNHWSRQESPVLSPAGSGLEIMANAPREVKVQAKSSRRRSMRSAAITVRNRRECVWKSDDRMIATRRISSDYQVINSDGYDCGLPRRRTHDHRAIDTLRLLSYRQYTIVVVDVACAVISRHFFGLFQNSWYSSIGLPVSIGGCPIGNGRTYS